MHAPTVSVEAESSSHGSSIDALSRATLAGFIASLTMLFSFLVAYNLARLLSAVPILAWPTLERQSWIRPATWTTGASQAEVAPGNALGTLGLWLANLTHNRLIDAGLSDVYLAAGIYILGGVLWALLYTVVEPRLGGSPVKRGVLFAMLPCLVSLVVVMPALGAGFLGLALGAGPLPAIGNVLLHVVYGAILGIVYGPFGDRDASTLERPVSTRSGPTPSGFERIAALLLIGGLVVGGLLGLAATASASPDPAHSIIGASSGGLILSGALLGAAIGLMAGSFLGLGDSSHRHSER
jgi:hypothetical protein